MEDLNKEISKAFGNSIDRRKFLKLAAAFGLSTATGVTSAYAFSSSAKAKVIIIGGGCAGISMAARLLRWLRTPDITIIDPSDTHYYQPGFTLIASGVYDKDEVYKAQKDCIPSGAKWIKDSVVAVDPDNRLVYTQKNGSVGYDFMVLAPGLQLNWNGVEGIDYKNLGVGDAHCMYIHEGAIKTWDGVQKFVKEGGKGIYTDTYTKHKCGGAPKKICLLTEHLSRKRETRQNLQFNFYTASSELYDVPYFTPRLLEIYKERDINLNCNVRVKGIDTSAKKAYLEKVEKVVKEKVGTDGKKEKVVEKVATPIVESYDFMHFLPPMGAPDFVKASGLSWTEGSLAKEGWAMVDKETLVHKKYPNIISLGDVAGIPTSKTSAAIRKQTPIAAKNLIALMEGRAPAEKYDGYAACPIITDYGHIIMCEFDYNKKEKISFPLSLLDMSHEQWVAWLLKVYVLKPMYFYGMLKGLV